MTRSMSRERTRQNATTHKHWQHAATSSRRRRRVRAAVVSVAEPKSEPGLSPSPSLSISVSVSVSRLVIGQKSVGSSRRSSVRMTTLRAKSMSTFLLPVVVVLPLPSTQPAAGRGKSWGGGREPAVCQRQKDPGAFHIKTWIQRQLTKLSTCVEMLRNILLRNQGEDSKILERTTMNKEMNCRSGSVKKTAYPVMQELR